MGEQPRRHWKLDLVVDRQITRDQLVAQLDRVLKLAGCPACGLGGIDLRWRGEVLNDFGHMAGVKGGVVESFGG